MPGGDLRLPCRCFPAIVSKAIEESLPPHQQCRPHPITPSRIASAISRFVPSASSSTPSAVTNHPAFRSASNPSPARRTSFATTASTPFATSFRRASSSTRSVSAANATTSVPGRALPGSPRDNVLGRLQLERQPAARFNFCPAAERTRKSETAAAPITTVACPSRASTAAIISAALSTRTHSQPASSKPAGAAVTSSTRAPRARAAAASAWPSSRSSDCPRTAPGRSPRASPPPSPAPSPRHNRAVRAMTRTSRALHHSIRNRRRSREPPTPHHAARQVAALGLDHPHPALTQQQQVRYRRRMLPHVHVIAGATITGALVAR